MSVTLKVSKREVRPRSVRNKLRHEGQIPAVVNGYQVESTPISLDGATLGKFLRENGVNTVITMDIDGKKVNTLIHKYTADTFTGALTHIEFLSVNMKETTEVEAEIVLIGEAKGVKEGGVLTQTLHAVTVSATPDNLPERIEVSVENLGFGDTVTVAELKTDGSFEIITEGEETIATITEAQEVAESDDSSAVEPEVIGAEASTEA